MDFASLTPAVELAGKRNSLFPGESPDYRRAREDLLRDEIELRRQMTKISEQRMALPPGPLIELSVM